jgi:two-component system, OmpR family, alkaline phosphatase synthesis response regulator PhoP
MGRKILVVEDEPDIAELIKINLKAAGFEVESEGSGDGGLHAAQKNHPDLMLLDIMLPGMSGLDVCQKIKGSAETKIIPIIIVSAKGDENDIVKGLELGAEDYITKPFSPKILVARVEAVLRRFSGAQVPSDEDEIKFGVIKLNPKRVEVTIGGQKTEMTQSEFKILHHLIRHPGWVFTRAQMVQAIHGENYAVTDRTIDFQMVGLRKKLGEAGDYIETVRGVGYRFKDSI